MFFNFSFFNQKNKLTFFFFIYFSKVFENGVVLVEHNGKFKIESENKSTNLNSFLNQFSEEKIQKEGFIALQLEQTLALEFSKKKSHFPMYDDFEKKVGHFASDLLIRLNTALVPAPITDVHGDNRWNSIYNRHLSNIIKEDFSVLLAGDSLIQHMEMANLWKNLKKFKPVNFGIGGDEIQNLLWRIKNAKFEVQNKIIKKKKKLKSKTEI